MISSNEFELAIETNHFDRGCGTPQFCSEYRAAHIGDQVECDTCKKDMCNGAGLQSGSIVFLVLATIFLMCSYN